MLVLSRRPEEKILLPTVPAVIKVIAAQSGLVRLGIEAPSHVPILREELFDNDPAALGIGRSDEGTANLRHAVRSRINNLILGLTLLRMELTDSGALAVPNGWMSTKRSSRGATRNEAPGDAGPPMKFPCAQVKCHNPGRNSFTGFATWVKS